MAGGYERAYGSRIELEADGGSISAGSFVLCADNNILQTDDEGYPYLMFYGLVDWLTTPPSNTPLNIYAQPLNLISTNNAEAPQNDCLSIYLGAIIQEDESLPRYYTPPDVIIHRPHFECSIYVNNPLSSGTVGDFQLYCYPWTYRRTQ